MGSISMLETIIIDSAAFNGQPVLEICKESSFRSWFSYLWQCDQAAQRQIERNEMAKRDKKERKDKKDKKDRKRKRDRDDSSDSDDERAHRRLQKEVRARAYPHLFPCKIFFSFPVSSICPQSVQSPTHQYCRHPVR